MKFWVVLGVAALVVAQAAAVPAAEPEAGVGYKLKAHKHKGKHHKGKHHKHKHHKHKKVHKHKKYKGVPYVENTHHLGEGYCGLPGMFCAIGKRDVVEGHDEGYCGAPGNPCNRVKRTAWAIADALEDARAVPESESYCGAPGTPCEAAEEAIDEIALKARGIYGNVYAREADAFAAAEADLDMKRSEDSEDSEVEAYKNDDLGICDAGDTPCLAVRDANPALSKRDAEAEPRRRKALGQGFCGLPGTFCMLKRDAEAEPRRKALGQGFCGLPGTFCMLKREADAAAQPRRALGQGFCGLPGTFCMLKRNADAAAEAEAEPRRKALGQGFCGLPGTFCMKKRDAEAEARRKALGQGFCGLPGTFCMLKREEEQAKRQESGSNYCGLPGAPCLDGREAKDLVNILSRADPEWLRDECKKDGHACNTLYKIRDAFHAAKNESNYLQGITDPLDKFAYCGEEGSDKCNAFTWAHQYAAKHNPEGAAQAEKRCAADDGICTAAKRDLDELESTIDAAIAVIEKA